MRITGVSDVQDALRRLDEVPDRTRARVLTRAAQRLLDAAVGLAPTDQDPDSDERPDYVKLRESAKILRRKNGRAVRFATRHAAAQHERMEWQHEDGQPKFLEQPLRAMRATLMQDLANDAEAEVARVAARARKRSGSGSGRGRDSRGRFTGASE